jgi:dephospho-CoA kinase
LDPILPTQEELHRLERLVHPIVHREKKRLLRTAAARGDKLVVLDIPLLYETGAEAGCDAVAVASAPAEAQRTRVLARPGMTEEKMAAILARQMPDVEKRRRADFVIDTGLTPEETEGHVRALVQALAGRGGTAYERLIAEDG